MAGRHQAHHSLGLLVPAHALSQLAAGLQPLASEPDLCAARVQQNKVGVSVLHPLMLACSCSPGRSSLGPNEFELEGQMDRRGRPKGRLQSRSSVAQLLLQAQALSRICSELAAACQVCWAADLRLGVADVEGCSDVKHSSEVWPTGGLIAERLQVRPQVTQRMPQLVGRQATALLDLILYMAVACLPPDCGDSVEFAMDAHILALAMLVASCLLLAESTETGVDPDPGGPADSGAAPLQRPSERR